MNYSVLEKLPPSEWAIVDFIITTTFSDFFSWVKEFVAAGFQEELISLDGKSKIHLQSARYDPQRIICIGGYLINQEHITQIQDIISFVFTVKVGNDRYSISATSHPIAFPFFIKLLNEMSCKWPETKKSVEEYIARLQRLAEGLSSTKSKGGRRSQYSESERDLIVEEWLEQDEKERGTLEVFLVDKFGEKDESSIDPRPNVSTSTFYNWEKDYYKRHPEKKKKKYR